MSINEYVTHSRKLVDAALDKHLPDPNTKPRTIHRAMRYAVFPGGKRIRPILTIASFEACGGAGDKILPVACAIELIHTYTLIHDDLPCMDNDDYRRGKLSCHKKFNESIALLTGDALLTLAFQLLSERGNIEIVSIVAKAIGSRGTIGGQVVDILTTNACPPKPKTKAHGFDARRAVQRRRDELNYIASSKTGALFEAALKVGGIFSKAGKIKIEALSNFGRLVGFTFQLMDDLADNDGYVKICGAVRTKEKARALMQKAKKHLNIFGKKAVRLSEIADLLIGRGETSTN